MPPLYEGGRDKSTATRVVLAIAKLHVSLAPMKLFVPVLILLAACNEEAPLSEANRLAPAASPNAPAAANSTALSAPKALSAQEETDLYEFKYSWSAEASAVPQLADRFTKDTLDAVQKVASKGYVRSNLRVLPGGQSTRAVAAMAVATGAQATVL